MDNNDVIMSVANDPNIAESFIAFMEDFSNMEID